MKWILLFFKRVILDLFSILAFSTVNSTGQWLWLWRKAVSSDTRGLRFKSRHQQSFIELCLLSTVLKTKIKKKRPGMAHFLQFTVHTCSVKKFIDVSTRTGGLWGRKQPLCQLSHNHCLKSDYFSPPLCRFSIKMQTRTRTDIDQTEPRGWAHTLLSPKPQDVVPILSRLHGTAWGQYNKKLTKNNQIG